MWLCLVVRSCATRDDAIRDNVCTPAILSGINRPPHLRPSCIYLELRDYETPPTVKRASPSQNGQPHRQPDYPPGSKKRFCLDFVSITFGCQERLYLANVCLVVPIYFSSLVSRKLQRRSYGGKLVPCALLVEDESACSKPPAGVDLRISTGERHGFGTSCP